MIVVPSIPAQPANVAMLTLWHFMLMQSEVTTTPLNYHLNLTSY